MNQHHIKVKNSSRFGFIGMVIAGMMLVFVGSTAWAGVSIDTAVWDAGKRRLIVTGTGDKGEVFKVVNANDIAQILGSKILRKDGGWTVRSRRPSPVPCEVGILESNNELGDTKDVDNAPADCGPMDPPPDNKAPVCVIDTPATDTMIATGAMVNYTSTVTDEDGNLDTINWVFPGGAPAASGVEDPGNVIYNVAGVYLTTLDATDDLGAACEQQTRTITVVGAPPPNSAPVCVIDTPATDTMIATGATVNYTGTVTDVDGNLNTISWVFPGGNPGASNVEDPGNVTYGVAGVYETTLDATDDEAAACEQQTRTITVEDAPPPPSDVSINSTSQNGSVSAAVTEQPAPGQPGSGDGNHVVFSINDLGMHCGDLDTRISSILPPFNVIHTQVLLKGGNPDILTMADGVEVTYSAASNSADPSIGGFGPTGEALLSSRVGNTVFKTNFWDTVNMGAYDPFYPPVITPLIIPDDVGLPVPNVERLYLGDGVLEASQQSMPGVLAPYTDNVPQLTNEFIVDMPFFNTFPFGYDANGVNWFEIAGLPISAFDDFGLENAYPLVRVQARSGDTVLATVDTVVPISGEANCQGCHGADGDGGNGSAIRNLAEVDVASSLDDPQLGVVPLSVSVEYASDMNILRLHDQKHGTELLMATPVVCQTCHYTPALDLAHVGPKGPGDADANGREQTNVRSMSNVMHSHHATVEDGEGTALFPAMPPPKDGNGVLRDPVAAAEILEQTCYACHPGRRTQCLRGAMSDGGMLCQDCHGEMAQVGDDFSRNVHPGNVGAFELEPDFYTNPATPRVPWANEPGCGSCHTGDAVDNMNGVPDTIAADDIRLLQAFLSNDAKATPIVPTNKRFAEDVVESGDAAGNPKLYRVSTGHEGVFCEACHGATHAIWPNANPLANDNITAQQLQGHTGTITQCSACHQDVDLGLTLDGPHGLHEVSQISDNGAAIDPASVITTWNMDHKQLNDFSTCRTCHGLNGEGTVLSRTSADRTLECKEDNAPGCTRVVIDGNEERRVFVAKGTEVSCILCHENEIN